MEDYALLLISMPVSYTHLMHQKSGDKAVVDAFGGWDRLQGLLMAVSYTHLDVYKRQTIKWVFPSFSRILVPLPIICLNSVIELIHSSKTMSFVILDVYKRQAVRVPP